MLATSIVNQVPYQQKLISEPRKKDALMADSASERAGALEQVQIPCNLRAEERNTVLSVCRVMRGWWGKVLKSIKRWCCF